jgi:vacuolar-type H+-ATPase subunit I/STV1
MTNEEMQKAIEFIIEHEAKSSAKIDALAETQTRTGEGIRALLSIAEIHEREINTLGHQVSALSREIGNLGETTRATDERLNALINVVERQISEGRNGKP